MYIHILTASSTYQARRIQRFVGIPGERWTIGGDRRSHAGKEK